jgi:phage-related protein
MAEDGKIVYKVVLNDEGVINEAQAAGEKAGQGVTEGSRKHSGAFREIWIGAMREIGAAFVNMARKGVEELANITKAAVNSTAALEQNVGGIETLFGTGGKNLQEYAASVGKTQLQAFAEYQKLNDAQERMLENASKAYKTAGLSANEYMTTVTSFSASLIQSLGGDTAKAAIYADKAVIDMADNANKMGTDISMIQSAYQGFARQNYTMLDNLKLGYGGTKSEMERLIKDAEKLDSSFQATRDENGELTMSFADITQAIHVVQNEMGITGTTAKEASSTIEGSVNSAKAAYDNFLNGTGSAEEFADAIITAATNIGDNVATITERFATELPDLVLRLGEALPGLIEKVGPPVFQAVKGIISSLLKLLLDNLPAMVESGIEMLTSLLDGFAQSGDAGQILATVLLVIRTIANAIIKNLPTILSAGVSILMQLLTGIAQSIPLLLNMIGELILNLFNSFISADWKSIGHNIVEGVKNGISGLWGSLVESVEQGVKNLWESAKRALGIASPSKKFKYIGEMTTEGTIEGIEDTQAEMTRTVTDVYGGMADSAQSALTRDLGSLEQNVSYNLTAAGKLPDMTIVVPLTLDGREIARATAWSMGEQLAWEEL